MISTTLHKAFLFLAMFLVLTDFILLWTVFSVKKTDDPVKKAAEEKKGKNLMIAMGVILALILVLLGVSTYAAIYADQQYYESL